MKEIIRYVERKRKNGKRNCDVRIRRKAKEEKPRVRDEKCESGLKRSMIYSFENEVLSQMTKTTGDREVHAVEEGKGRSKWLRQVRRSSRNITEFYTIPKDYVYMEENVTRERKNWEYNLYRHIFDDL